MGRGKHLPRSRPGPIEIHEPGALTKLVDEFDVRRKNEIDQLATRLAIWKEQVAYLKDAVLESRKNPKAALALGVMATPSMVSVELADIPSEVETDVSGRIVSIPAAERIITEKRVDFSPESKKQYSQYQTEVKTKTTELPAAQIDTWQTNADGSLTFSLIAGKLPDGQRTTLSEIADRLHIPGGWQSLHKSYNSNLQNPDLLISGIDRINIHIEKPYVYEVKKGDTLSEISSRTGVFNYQQLAELNGIEDPDTILVGQKIMIPFETKGWEPYTVQPGDTLGNLGFEIDGVGGVEASTIARLNMLEDADLINIGSTILIPVDFYKQSTVTAEAETASEQISENHAPNHNPEPGVDNGVEEQPQNIQPPETDKPKEESKETPQSEEEPKVKEEPEPKVDAEPEIKPPEPKPEPGTQEISAHLNAMHRYTDGFVPSAEELKIQDKESFEKLAAEYVKAKENDREQEFMLNLRDEQLESWAESDGVGMKEAVSNIVGDIVRAQGLDWEEMDESRRKLWLEKRDEVIDSIIDGDSISGFEAEFTHAIEEAKRIHEILRETNPQIGELSDSLAVERAINVLAGDERSLVIGLAHWIESEPDIRPGRSAEFIIGERLVYELRNKIAIPLNSDTELDEAWIKELGILYVDGKISFGEIGDSLEENRNAIRSVYDLFHRYTSPKDDWPNKVRPTVPGDSVNGPLLDERAIKLLVGELSLSKLRSVLADHYAEEYGVDTEELYRVMAWLIMHEHGISDDLKGDLDEGIGLNLVKNRISLQDVMAAATEKDEVQLKELALDLHLLKPAGFITAYLPPNHGPLNSEGYMAMPTTPANGAYVWQQYKNEKGELVYIAPPSDRCALPDTIARVYTVADLWQQLGHPPLLLGDFNAEVGHVSHVNGVDVDLDSVARGFSAGDMTKSGYDKEATLELARLFAQVDSKVVIFFNDVWVIKNFNAWSKANGLGARMAWENNHHNHFHVRFSSQKGTYSGACAKGTVHDGDGGGITSEKPDDKKSSKPHKSHKKMLADLPPIRKLSRQEVVDGDWGTKFEAKSFALGIITSVAEGNKPAWQDKEALIDVVSTFWHESANGYVHARGDIALGHKDAESNGWCQMYYAPHKSWGKSGIRLPENNMDVWQHLRNCYALFAETGSLKPWMAHKSNGGPSDEFEGMFREIVEELFREYDIDW